MDQSAGTFTAHNILLDDGRQTLPQSKRLLAQEPWCIAAIKTLRAVFPAGLKGVRIVDLACLEGGYAVEFARLGMDSLGIEVRTSNFQNCELVKRGLALPNLNFVQDDVWNLERYGEFDAIYCCGLLYHLDRPREFLTLLSKLCRKVLILNTHFATDHENKVQSLSKPCQNEGLTGRWLIEFPKTFTGNKDAEKWASWSNDRSFWPMRPDLLSAMYGAGFPIVMEQYDWMGNGIAAAMTKGDYYSQGRGIFVGMKP